MGRRPRPESSSCAVLIFEAPWELYETDSNRASVLPFFDGLSKLTDNVTVFHANFYDIESFKLAFLHLAKARYQNTIIYIAAHGYRGEISDIPVAEYLDIIREKSKALNISGVILGSCYSAEESESFIEKVEGSALRWCVGYQSTVNWLQGTMVDVSLVHSLLNLYDTNDNDPTSVESEIIGCFVNALECFNPNYELGFKYHRKKKITLRESLKVVIQPSGHGKRAKLLGNELWTKLDLGVQ